MGENVDKLSNWARTNPAEGSSGGFRQNGASGHRWVSGADESSRRIWGGWSGIECASWRQLHL